MNRASHWYSLAMPFSHKLNCFTLPLPDKKKQMLNSAKEKLFKKKKKDVEKYEQPGNFLSKTVSHSYF